MCYQKVFLPFKFLDMKKIIKVFATENKNQYWTTMKNDDPTDFFLGEVEVETTSETNPSKDASDYMDLPKIGEVGYCFGEWVRVTRIVSKRKF